LKCQTISPVSLSAPTAERSICVGLITYRTTPSYSADHAQGFSADGASWSLTLMPKASAMAGSKCATARSFGRSDLGSNPVRGKVVRKSMQWNPPGFHAAMTGCTKTTSHSRSSVFQDGKAIGIGPAYDAAKYILENWPDEAAGPKLETCKEILLTCLEGECPAAIARVALVEAAREANIFVETAKPPLPTGKLDRWYKTQPRRRSTPNRS
jgi:hypothetical protein